MKRFLVWILTAALLLPFALCLSACSSQEEDAIPTTPSDDQAPSPEESPDEPNDPPADEPIDDGYADTQSTITDYLNVFGRTPVKNGGLTMFWTNSGFSFAFCGTGVKASINTSNEAEVRAYLERMLDGKEFDRSGLIYGIGHAVYSLSDPRAVILRKYARRLSEESGMLADFEFYERVAELAPRIINERRNIHKAVSPNVDFYSGLVYRMLGIPEELFTPLFAMARIAGWSAHRLEEIQNAGKIIRPAYIGVKEEGKYTRLNERK